MGRIAMIKLKRLALLVVLSFSILLCNVRAEENEKGLYAYFLDVGQGDATVIICDGEVMMIDGGDAEHSQYVYSFLRNTIAIDTIDVLIATHPHADHIGGLPRVLNAFQVDDIYTPTYPYNDSIWETLVKCADLKGATILQRESGDQFMVGGACITILGPVFPAENEKNKNNISLVFRVDYDSISFLFAGDAEWEEEHAILDSDANLDADVLHVSHHGSRTGTGYRFLREVMPAYGIISVGKGNAYGHPHEEALSRLRDAGVQVFRTDQSGTIMCYTDGMDISFTEMFR